MSVTVSTRQYVASHLRQPRGTGYWWFEVAGERISFFGTYAAAKKRAIQHAKAVGAEVVFVLP